jgi:hypothetical protein
VVILLALGVGCAEGSQQGTLNGDTLVDHNAGATAGGNVGTAGATGGAGMATGGGGMAAAGMSGSPAVAGAMTGGAGAGGIAAGGTAGGGGGGMGGTGGGGAGGMGGGGMAGAGGAAAGGHRYVKLVALSEMAGHPWSSCAELGVLTSGDVQIVRAGWSAMADSAETVDQSAPASNAIDGDSSTFWHTEWAPGGEATDPKPPHYLIVDMGAQHPVVGFTYLPRQDGPNGHIKDWEFYVSDDGQNWGQAVKTGTFPDDTGLQTETF